MNVFLWILQILLALHTTMGAVWKLSHSEQAVPSLSAIPHGAWLAMSAVELLCALALLAPALSRRLGILAPIAVATVIAEMLLFTAVHLASGVAEHNEIVYWMVVAAICGFLLYGRLVLRPLPRG
jgi:glucose dehydrogenase